jgi:hypothetical protein
MLRSRLESLFPKYPMPGAEALAVVRHELEDPRGGLGSRAWKILPATSSTLISNRRLLSQTASYAVASEQHSPVSVIQRILSPRFLR